MRALTEYQKASKILGGSQSFSARLYALLNRPRNAKFQNEVGAYTKRTSIGLKHFESHLLGSDTIAVSVVDGGRANFLAIDVDANFEQRLPIFAAALRERGLATAAFAVTGSSPGRGKVIITLQNRLPQRQAVTMVDGIVSEVLDSPGFGQFKSSEVSTFPTNGDGSHVRLLGRNQRRAQSKGVHEVALDLDGNVTDLFQVVPADIEATQKRPLRHGLSSWAKEFCEHPFTGRTPDLFKAQARFGHEAYREYGDGALSFIIDAFRKVAENSPNLTASSRRNLMRSDTAARVFAYAKTANGGNHISVAPWSPMTELAGFPKPAVRVYHGMAEHVLDNGLDANCFGITTQWIADRAGYAGKGKAWQALLVAVDEGLVVRLDSGVPREEGRDGLCGLYGLVGEGTDVESVRVAGMMTPMYRKRSDERERRGLPRLPMLSTSAILRLAA